MSDLQVINSIKNGGQDEVNKSISSLYAQNYAKVERYLLAKGSTREQVKDIFQEAILVVFRKIRNGDFRGDSTVSTFLFAVCKIIWLKEVKRESQLGSLTSSLELADRELLDQPAYEPDRRIELADVIKELGQECQEILVSFYYKKMSMMELKEKYRLDSIGAMKNRKYRCLKSLIAIIDKKNIKREDLV